MRAIVLGVAVLLTAGGLVCLFLGDGRGWPMTAWGLLLLASVVLERWRYARRAGAGPWQETGERFIDPETGKAMQVLYNAQTGERRYADAEDQTTDN
jgi:hypothetical protein